MMQQLYSRRIF